MYQVYFLSVVTLVLASVSAGFDRFDEQIRVGAFFSRDLFTSPGFRLGLGLITALVGFLKFIVVAGSGTVIVGDLLPAVAGIVLGATLTMMFYKAKATVESDTAATLERLLIGNASNFAMLGLLIAVLHLLLPRVIFL